MTALIFALMTMTATIPDDLILDSIAAQQLAMEQMIDITDALDRIERMQRRIIEDQWGPLSLQIDRIYREELHRAATTDEMTAWKDRFFDAPLTAAEVRAKLLDHPERKGPQPKPVIPTPEPEPEPEPKKTLRGNFLFRNATWTTHAYMSDRLTDADRRAMVQTALNAGENVLSLYAWCDGDYAGKFPVNFIPSRKDHWIHWLKPELIDKGLEPIIWMMPDDPFRHFDRGNMATVKAKWAELIDLVLRPLGITRLVLGLEAVEYWSGNQINELGQWLEDYYPEAWIGFHTHPDDLRYLDLSWVDWIAYQYGFGKSQEFIDAKTREVMQQFSDKVFIAAEYHMSGETEPAKTMGDAAINAGAAGYLNGGSRP
jgi:hypothetical protein